ncbi:MAG: dihydropteroate synthase [Pyrinomonadaceae bacterium]
MEVSISESAQRSGRAHSFWRCGGFTFEFSARPVIMAILNVTPDSFSDGGENLSLDDALRTAERLFEEGADILDIGGESTRPGAEKVSAELEKARVAPVISAICDRFEKPISIDTFKSEVALAALDAGASIINDISGFKFDARMVTTAASSDAGVVLMHVAGLESSKMHELLPDGTAIDEVSAGLRESLKGALEAGIDKSRIALDMGIGFGKSQDQNLELLREIPELKRKTGDYPFLVGLSRKSFIGRITGEAEPRERFSGTIAANLASVLRGADILRVHDVAETIKAVKVFSEVLNL